MNKLELKKLKVELLRVQAARAELEFRVDEHKDNIQRIEDNIKLQLEKEEELNLKIKEMESKQ